MYRKLLSLFLCLFLLSGKTGRGAPFEPSAPAAQTPTLLPEVAVTATPAPESEVLPSQSPSVYGPDLPVLDTPRQVTPIRQTLMRSSGMTAQGYLDPLSTAFLIPGAVSENAGATMGAPTIRGMAAQPYINGMQMTVLYAGGLLTPFNWNMVESEDITEGPANAVFGEQQAAGGTVTYFTKQPYWLPYAVGSMPDRTNDYGGIVAGLPFWVQGTFAWKF